MRRALACVGIALAFGAGCSGERNARSLLEPHGGGTIVVDARLIVWQRFPAIRLSTTQSPDQTYYNFTAALRGAQVFLTFSPGFALTDTAFYRESETPGVYELDRSTGDPGPRPSTTYTLHVEAADGRVVTAQTTTPAPVRVREWVLLDSNTLEVRRNIVPLDTLYYEDGLVEARFDRGSALAFQMALFNLEDNSPLLIDADFIDEADLASLERQSSSPPLDAPDGYVRLPWLAVWYEGRHRYEVYSLDRNWYDIARSVRFNGPANLGFGSNAGDEFERPIFHVEGGIGLFGSAAVDWTYFTVLPRP
jgi:hypothetical protein